jgi:benzylsuccinate CoA-transferase BbsF subunit
MPEGLLEYAMSGREPERKGNHDLMMSPHNCYKAAGDAEKWVSIAVGTEAEWHALCRAIGKAELAVDPRFGTAAQRKLNEAALDDIITEWSKGRDRWETTRILQAAGVAAFPSMSAKDLAEDRHLRERGYLVELEHPEVGRRIHAGIPWQMSDSTCRVKAAAPILGADSEPVLRSLLGLSAEDIERLRKAEVVI